MLQPYSTWMKLLPNWLNPGMRWHRPYHLCPRFVPYADVCLCSHGAFEALQAKPVGLALD